MNEIKKPTTLSIAETEIKPKINVRELGLPVTLARLKRPRIIRPLSENL